MTSLLLLRGTRDELSSPRAEKILETARFASIAISRQEMSPADLQAITPFAQALVLSFRNEVHITTSIAMMRTIASLAPAFGLLGNSDLEDAIVDSWLSFIWTSLDVPLHAIQIDDEQQPSKVGAATMIQTSLDRAFGILNSQLKDRLYLVGDDGITLADISLAVTVKNASDYGDSILKKYSNLSSWYTRILDQGITVQS